MTSKNNSKRAAIEMSMTTIVTIVLVVVTLVLALVLIRTIFTSSTSAVEQIDTAIQDQINKLFASEGTSLAVYPAARQITLKKGDVPKGFAFSVKNNDVESATFSYNIVATDVTSCGSTFTAERANAFLLGGTGSFSLGAGNKLDLPILVKFSIPESSPPCTIVYTLNVDGTASGFPTSTNIFVTIE